MGFECNLLLFTELQVALACSYKDVQSTTWLFRNQAVLWNQDCGERNTTVVQRMVHGDTGSKTGTWRQYIKEWYMETVLQGVVCGDSGGRSGDSHVRRPCILCLLLDGPLEQGHWKPKPQRACPLCSTLRLCIFSSCWRWQTLCDQAGAAAVARFHSGGFIQCRYNWACWCALAPRASLRLCDCHMFGATLQLVHHLSSSRGVAPSLHLAILVPMCFSSDCTSVLASKDGSLPVFAPNPVHPRFTSLATGLSTCKPHPECSVHLNVQVYGHQRRSWLTIS